MSSPVSPLSSSSSPHLVEIRDDTGSFTDLVHNTRSLVIEDDPLRYLEDYKAAYALQLRSQLKQERGQSSSREARKPIQSISFTSLPVAVRHTILAYTDLVPDTKCLVVEDGRLTDFEGAYILNVRNKAFREDAHFILFNQNRLKFISHPASFLSFMRGKQPWIRHVRELYFVFTEDQIDKWVTGGERLIPTQIQTHWFGPPALDQSWLQVVEFVGQNIPLENLTITLDAWDAREGYVISNCDETVLPNTIDAYNSMVKPLTGWGRRGLKAFIAMWALFMDRELEAERLVMGNDYVPDGKITPESRWLYER